MKYIFSLLCVLVLTADAGAKDYFLTIGGGPSRETNQASIERNILFYQQLLTAKSISPALHWIYFASGISGGKDVQTMDAASLPVANRLMAEFFGTERNLGLGYRTSEIAGIRGASTVDNIESWFRGVGSTMRAGDRLILYVTAHGDKSEDRRNPFETSIMLWSGEKLVVSELVRLLETLPEGVQVVAVMVQCYTGGFARMIFDGADPENGLAKQNRSGFFATVHDREAAGCTPDVEEASYVEYSTYFWEALGGRSRTGEPMTLPDFDGDGKVSFAEAHAYTLIHADTIDLPLTTSNEFLSEESQFRDDDHPDLLPRETSYDTIYELATPAERAVLEGLSKQLGLTGNDRVTAAQREVRTTRRGRLRSRGPSPRRRASQLRDTIAGDLKERWPELGNVLNPGSIEFITERSKEFIEAVEGHPKYKEYREQMALAEKEPDPEKRRVKHERFLLTVQDVILRENLKRLNATESLAQYEVIAAAEAGTL